MKYYYCKNAKKHDKGHIKCNLDGSIRAIYKGCPCNKYKLSRVDKIIKFLFGD